MVPGFDEELRFFVAPSKCGGYDVLWQDSDWDDEDGGNSALAWLPKDTLAGTALWEALLARYWKAEKTSSNWDGPNFHEVITDKKAKLSPEAVWEIVERIWPPQ